MIPILVQLNGETEAIHETWLNAHQIGGGMVYLQDLATQPRLSVVLYRNRSRERIYRRYPSPKALWRGLKYDYS